LINNGTILFRVQAPAANPILQDQDHIGNKLLKVLKCFEQLLCLADVVYLVDHVGHTFKMILH